MKQRHFYTFAVLIVLLLPCSTWADSLKKGDSFTVDGITYKITNLNPNEVQVGKGENRESSFDKNTTGEIVISSSILAPDGNKYTVSSIGNYAFYECSKVNSITIPNTVKSIGEYAFYFTHIAITIPNSTETIGAYAFMHNNMKAITIPGSVKTIGERAFMHCSELESINIGGSVNEIGSFLFNGCDKLTSIIVDADNNEFDSRDNCNAIIKTSTNKLIEGCQSTIIPNTVETIGTHAFHGCRYLESIAIPKSVLNIEYQAFGYCRNLKSISISSGVSNIESNPFIGCSSLKSITVDKDNQYYDSRNGCNAIVKSDNNELIVGCQNTSIENTIENIGYGAFGGCTGLSSIIIPNSVKNIKGGAFSGCSNMTKVDIPNSVKAIYSYAFENCSNLTSVTIPNTLKLIELGLFKGCEKLSKIEIPETVEVIEKYAFMGCSSLTSLTIPGNVEEIWERAFEGCEALTEVYSFIRKPFKIPSDCWNKVKTGTIPLYVLAGTKALYEATDGWKEFKNIVEMGESEWEKYGIFTFDGIDYCIEDGEAFVQFVPKDITGRVVIPSTVSAPDRKAYSVTAIGYVAFKECIGITEIVLPNTIVEICDEAFVRCTGLNSIEIPNSVVSIGKDAFYNCAYLKSIEIPNSVITIGNGAFEKCGMLSAVTIGQSVKAIGARAFYDIKSSGKLISLIPEPFIIDNSVFTDLFKGIAQLYVPAGTKALYEATEGWKDFKNIVEMVNIDPIEGETTVNTANLISQDLSDNVVDDVYYNTGDGSYDATDGSIVINETTNMGQITNAVPGSDDVKNNFTGIILKVAAGKGTITVNVKTIGNAQLVVQVGNATPMIASKTEQGDVVVSYDVAEDTYVYIYAIIGSSASPSMRASSTDEVRIYGFTVSPGASGVKAVWANEDSKAQIFSLDGKPLNEPQKGVNIVRMSNGQVRKVVVK